MTQPREHDDPALAVRDLRVRFRTGREDVLAVKDVSFTVQPSETLAIVGESGSGKSATCLAIPRLLPGTAEVRGSIRFGGRELLELSQRELRHVRGKEIGLIYQDPMAALNPVRTIGAQISEVVRLHLKMSRRAARERSAELLNAVGVTPARRQLRAYPHEFSGGMRQRVVIAMAIACEPKLVIADEPTTALDVSIQAQILLLLRKLASEQNISLVFVSHDLSVVAGLADKVAVMYAGTLVEYASALELYESPVHPYTRALLAAIPDRDHIPITPRLEQTTRAVNGERSTEGCPFRRRCPSASGQCTKIPELTETAANHFVACWRAEEGGQGGKG